MPCAEKDDIGTDRSFTNYPQGWAMAGNTPFKRYKQNLHGSTAPDDPLIISWPKTIVDNGAVRTQFVDVIDITPTILDITGVAAPKVYQGVPQMPLHGASIAATFRDANTPGHRKRDVRAARPPRLLWHDGWKAVTFPENPMRALMTLRWELYHVAVDFSNRERPGPTAPPKTGGAEGPMVARSQGLWRLAP